jgi:hypothetical protein
MKKLLIIIALVLLAGLPFVDWVVRNYSSNSPVALGQAGVPFVPIPTLPVYPGPVGPGSACALTEWICRDGDVIVPPVECHAVHYNPDTGEYSCRVFGIARQIKIMAKRMVPQFPRISGHTITTTMSRVALLMSRRINSEAPPRLTMRKHFITLTILILIITSGVLLTLIQNNNNNKEVKIINEPVNRKIEGIQAVDDLNDIDYSNLKKQFFISSFDESKIYVLDPGTFAIVGEVPFNLPHKILIIDNSTEMYVSAGDGGFTGNI